MYRLDLTPQSSSLYLTDDQLELDDEIEIAMIRRKLIITVTNENGTETTEMDQHGVECSVEPIEGQYCTILTVIIFNLIVRGINVNQ